MTTFQQAPNGSYPSNSPIAGEGSGSGRDRNTMMNRRLTAASLSNRNTNRYSVTALYSMAAEQDVEVEDDLARGTFHCPMLQVLTLIDTLLPLPPSL